ncbi:MAG TPA: UDP-N-acetylmuramate--L-alanine ligase [Acidimicrobiales bacterium]|nr:UDP-N-acetylmuramate--L-alanine ligase [Acidimicrobiales bacterium]
MTIDLSRPQHIHIVAIGGAAMNGIALLLAAMGHEVSGSDVADSPRLDRLRAAGIRVSIGHAAEHADGADAVAVSTVIAPTNPEVVAALERGIPVLRRAEMLAAICATRRTVAISGTHGKTTTTAMLVLVLREAGLQPSYLIGGEVAGLESGAAWDAGDLLVVEADESDGTFVELPAAVTIVTSIEPDHLEHYGNDFQRLTDAFDRFIANATEQRIVCADDAVADAVGQRSAAITYGTSASATYRIADLVSDRSGSRFTLVRDGVALGEVSVPVLGHHNARNAAAALVAGLELGAPFDAGVRALAAYRGVARRVQLRGERDGVTYIDDFAHLPGEVRPVLDAVADGGWRRVVCVFEPHRYSRTEALWRDFAAAFDRADLLVVTDVYPAFEAPRPGVSGHLIVKAVLGHRPNAHVAYLPDRKSIAPYLRARLRPGDVCLTLGAGDLTTLADEMLA